MLLERFGVLAVHLGGVVEQRVMQADAPAGFPEQRQVHRARCAAAFGVPGQRGRADVKITRHLVRIGVQIVQDVGQVRQVRRLWRSEGGHDVLFPDVSTILMVI